MRHEGEEVQNEGAVSCEGGAKWRKLPVVRHKIEGAASCEGGEAQSGGAGCGCREQLGSRAGALSGRCNMELECVNSCGCSVCAGSVSTGAELITALGGALLPAHGVFDPKP